MLPPAMHAARRPLAALLAVLALTGGLAACGTEEGLEVHEGEPVEIGELAYNVQLTRFLNPNDVEDADYLAGQPPARPGTNYLGVFLRITNEAGHELRSAPGYAITDIRGERYEPLGSESAFALSIGAPVRAEGQLPPPGSPAASGPAAGALLIFLVDDTVIDRRPVKLEILAAEDTAEVELDI